MNSIIIDYPIDTTKAIIKQYAKKYSAIGVASIQEFTTIDNKEIYGFYIHGDSEQAFVYFILELVTILKTRITFDIERAKNVNVDARKEHFFAELKEFVDNGKSS